MDQRSNMLKVLSPVEGKNGKTFWIRIGNAFINRDGSTNVYLNAYPTSGKLQIRPLDDRDREPRGQYAMATADAMPAMATADTMPVMAGDDLPF